LQVRNNTSLACLIITSVWCSMILPHATLHDAHGFSASYSVRQIAFKPCFQFQLAPLQLGDTGSAVFKVKPVDDALSTKTGHAMLTVSPEGFALDREVGAYICPLSSST
jgi:hypothetical protein